MTSEQDKLVLAILNEIVDKHLPLIKHFHSFGANVGQCACGAIGQVKYPHIFYEHTDTCVISLNEKLQQSLMEEESKNEQ